MRLLGKDVLVQQFNAVESLSNVDVLCTDKTGTLTSGVVTFEELAGLGADDARAARLLGAFAASTTDANRTIEALRTALPAERVPAAHEAFFSSERKWSGLAFADGEARGTYVLGAPEIVARRCAPARPTGARRPTSGPRAACASCCSPGWPSRSPSATTPTPRPSLPRRASRRSPLICFSDELRPGVRGTLEEFSDAGIDVKIISGDNPQDGGRPRHAGGRAVAASAVRAWTRTATWSTRRARGATRGGADGDDAGAAAAPATPPRPRRPSASSSPSPGPSSPSSRRRSSPTTADEASIFGRVTPEQKQDLVEALRDRGRYVAMIGDGVNDVIALKQANVAVAMQGGSQAARSVGDLILMKDTFAPLPFAFREGQRIINGMNDILRIFMVRIFFKAAMIAIVTAIGGFPFAPRQSALLSFFGATVPAIAFALWAQPGPTPKVGLFKLLARFVLPTMVFMTAIGTACTWSGPSPRRTATWPPTPAPTEEQLIENAYPQAMTALTIFACFAAIFLILLIVPPSKWWSGGAPVVRNDWRMVGVVGFLFACMVVVLAVPLARTLFEITALPWWQYFVLLGLAFGWSQLCLLVWKTPPARPLAGHGGGPGQRVRQGGGRGGAEARR